ncbi:DNA internalization-related competence protein ComEC/Rec2 [Comamonas piscis]|uniref:DNA internalization-related competence protein ComEC/Rec2 n=1 Tax=Comamonas piscis TaxID=1562974 RepID=A0A7G5EFZ9_9BURK|nr:DNA internalization-related competence protein ComEC/Rec2 [Comamonas piscis]QMV72924.1 DNA internalization-related competence protein ComEC/Rec2 [Comamonas piscis]WSO35705.1 DNA internalization-related competence protein ComEC/Rec2 [Comamonas piscis]
MKETSTAGWRPSAWLWGILAGTALQLHQASLWPGTYYAACALLGVVATLLLARWRRPARWPDRALCCLAAAALALGLAGLRAANQASTALIPALEGVDLQVEGVVVAMPLPVAGGQRFRLKIERAWRDGEPVAVPPLMDLAWYRADHRAFARVPAEPRVSVDDALPLLQAGQRWRLPLRLRAPHGSLNPHGFDYEMWMWELGVQATGYVRHGQPQAPALLASQQGYAVERLRQQVRDAMVQQLAPAGRPQAAEWAGIAGVLVALVTGEQRAIDREDWRVFRITGVAHLMAISGLHITLFAWVSAAMIRIAWRRSPALCLLLPAPHVALWGGVVCAGLYAVFSGWGIPAQRTVLMLVVVAALASTGRQWPWYMRWLLACVCVVLAQPMALLQAGFWLSFLAVGILFASDRGPDRHSPALPQASPAARGLRGALAAALQLLREQWVVTLAITPLSLLLFGQVSVVGFLANLLAIPWVTWVVTPLALLGAVLPPLWDAAAWALRPLMAVLQWLATWPHAALWLAAAPAWAGLAAVVGGVWLVLPWPWRLRLLGLPCLLPALLWQPLRPAHGQFELWALDVGQGQAVLVQTARHSLLYDAGPLYGPGSNAGDRVVVPAMRAMGVHGLNSGRLDLLVLSHGHVDHTGGAEAVVEQLRPVAVMGSLLPHERQRLGIAAAPWQDCAAGQAWTWDGVQFSVLFPGEQELGTADSPIPRQSSGNPMSCVLRIEAAARGGYAAAALLPGDIERAQEAALVQRHADAPAALRADLMLAPHHGSNTSSTQPLLAAVRPRWVVAQTGYRNRFRHPAAAVQQRYQEMRIGLRNTVHCGAAHWQSDQPEVLVCERQKRPRYWRHEAVEVGQTRRTLDINKTNQPLILDEG